jgi:hypothetical protein
MMEKSRAATIVICEINTATHLGDSARSRDSSTIEVISSPPNLTPQLVPRIVTLPARFCCPRKPQR